MHRFISILSLLLFVSTISLAQEKVKFGKIDRADLEMMDYPTDSSAAAAFLYNRGITELDYDKGLGSFVYTFERHVRIKILDKAGLDWADFGFSLYENGSDREKLTKFNAIVYTLKNGKVQETKVGKKDLLTEQSSENYKRKKIAFPQVQEGSIIEIKYTIFSPFYASLVDWQFQYEIPVRYNEYRVSYPEWFTYKSKFKGYDLQYIEALELSPQAGNIVFNQVRTRNSSVGAAANSRIDYQKMKYGWIAKEMPAFEREAYISTIDNFLVSVDFELSSTNLPGSNWTSFAKTWEELGQTMMDSPSFGKQLAKGKTKFLAADVKRLTAGLVKPEEKIAALYYFLKSKVTWNNHQTTFVNTSLKEAFNKGKGNTADINLMLLGMLKQAGFTADPVLLSTKGHGFLNAAFPALRQFNYVIVRVEVADGKYMLLDATDKDLAMHLLPTKCINDKGLSVRKEGIKWVDLTTKGKYYLTRSVDLALNENMEWEGIMKVRCRDYAANNMRETYLEEENEAAYIATVESDNEGLNIEDYLIEGIKEIDKEVKENCKVNFNNQIMEGGDLLYFNPMLTYGMDENPFKIKERTYPVDYSYAQSKVYSFNFTIPDGYVVDELPEKQIIALPEKGGQFSYSAKLQGNKIMVLSQFKIHKKLFLPTEYPALKEFYNLVVAKHSEQIVLKKG